MRLQKLQIRGKFKNINNLEIDFSNKEGITVFIGNNGSGKSNILEAISSIFAGLFNSSFNPTFEYYLTYTIDQLTSEVTYKDNVYEIKENGISSSLKREYLPSQVIASYSGEEDRLWKEYYERFYRNYISALRGSTLPNSDLIYINRYYWNIALLTFYFYDFSIFSDIESFCIETLGIRSFNYVKFSFDLNRLRNWPSNPVTSFVRAINPNDEEVVQLDLVTLKDRLSYITNEVDFFKYLAAGFMPKDDKIITDIEISVNDNLESDGLSEGEKKLLLIKLILEVIGDENSLILLDEPDSHIHVSRKNDFKNLLSQYSNRENIITTHSPTLTHAFDGKHIVMLTKGEGNDVRIEPKEKREIIYELTKGIWSYQEQNIFLSSQNDILLIEGKSDETFIKKALEVLKATRPKYANLKFEYLPCGGADGVKLMSAKFKPKVGQKIIAFFDSDSAGWASINKLFDREANNKYNSQSFGSYRRKDEVWVAPYPIRPYFQGGQIFNVEDYFPKPRLRKHLLNNFKGLDSVKNKDTLKKHLESECQNFSDSDFRFFATLFDLILRIKMQ